MFRRVSSPQSLQKVIDFLTQDVLQHGGSASETINMHDHIWDIMVCQVPWGILVVKEEITAFEAWARLFNTE